MYKINYKDILCNTRNIGNIFNNYKWSITLAIVESYIAHLCMCARSVAQSCLTLCDPTGSSLAGSSVHGLFHGLPCPPPGDLPDLGIKSRTLMSPALAGGIFITGTTWEAVYTCN